MSSDMSISPDGSISVSGTGFNIYITKLADGSATKASALPGKNSITTSVASKRAFWYAWSVDSKTFASRTKKEIVLFNRDGKFLRYLTGPSASIYTRPEFAPDGSPRLAAVGTDHTVRVWDTETGRQLFCGVQLSPDQAAILDGDGNIVFGDPATVERELIYMIEYQDGRTAVLTPAEFKKLRP